MPILQCISNAVVLSPGVWRHIMAPASGNDGLFRSSLRLRDLLNVALTSSVCPSQWPINLRLDNPFQLGRSDLEDAPLLQLDRITPCDGPDFLLIHLPNEAAADITAH